MKPEPHPACPLLSDPTQNPSGRTTSATNAISLSSAAASTPSATEVNLEINLHTDLPSPRSQEHLIGFEVANRLRIDILTPHHSDEPPSCPDDSPYRLPSHAQSLRGSVRLEPPSATSSTPATPESVPEKPPNRILRGYLQAILAQETASSRAFLEAQRKV